MYVRSSSEKFLYFYYVAMTPPYFLCWLYYYLRFNLTLNLDPTPTLTHHLNHFGSFKRSITLNRITLFYSSTLYSSLLYSSLFFSTLLYSSLFFSALLYSNLHYTTTHASDYWSHLCCRLSQSTRTSDTISGE